MRRIFEAGVVRGVGLMLVVTGSVAACGEEGAGRVEQRSDAAEARMRAVSEAWDGSPAARAWREGYHPMGETARPPASGWKNKDDERAFDIDSFKRRGELPASAPSDGSVRWDDDRTLTVPLVSARKVYDSLNDLRSPVPHLTMTGAKLGTMTVETTRGPATVPAWLFTLDGYDTPLARAAVPPSKLAKPPIGGVRGQDAGGIDELAGLVRVADDGRSVTVSATHGACDDGPVIHARETDGSVVLSSNVTGARDGICTAEMLAQDVTVRLDRPLGDRILLDAVTGRPVPFGGRSDSWSE